MIIHICIRNGLSHQPYVLVKFMMYVHMIMQELLTVTEVVNEHYCHFWNRQ